LLSIPTPFIDEPEAEKRAGPIPGLMFILVCDYPSDQADIIHSEMLLIL